MQQAELYSTEVPREERMRKHVNAVALMPVMGNRKISLVDRRLYNLLLHFAQKQGDQIEYTARLHEIIRTGDYNSNNTKPLKDSLRNLMRTTVEWQSPTDGEIETWDSCTLLSGGGVDKNKRTGAVDIRWRYDSKVRAQLLSPDRYAGLNVPVMMQLSTHASLVLYEICSRYIDNPGHKTSRQHWRWWRPVLTGAPEDSGKGEYRYFKRDVLTPAIAEINANTDLEVVGPIEYKERDNKTICEIQFEVRSKRKRATVMKPLQQIEEAHLPIIGRAIKLQISQEDAEAMLLKHGPEALITGLEALEKRMAMPAEKVGAVKSPIGLLRHKLEKRQQPADAATTEGPAKKSGAVVDMAKKRAAWTDEWLRRRKTELIELFEENNEEEQTRLLAEFGVYLESKDKIILGRFKTSGWNHRMVRETFTRFLGVLQYGESWDKPSADDLLEIAAEAPRAT